MSHELSSSFWSKHSSSPVTCGLSFLILCENACEDCLPATGEDYRTLSRESHGSVVFTKLPAFTLATTTS